MTYTKTHASSCLLWLALWLVVSAMLGTTALAEEKPIQRSSHPRGFVEGGALPPIIVDTSRPTQENKAGAAADKTAGAAGGAAAQPASQAGATGGVNITGNTRIDARATGATATSVGQQNASGNRVGSIGGK